MQLQIKYYKMHDIKQTLTNRMVVLKLGVKYIYIYIVKIKIILPKSFHGEVIFISFVR